MALRLERPADRRRRLWLLDFGEWVGSPKLEEYNCGRQYAFFCGTEQEGRDAWTFGEAQWGRYARDATHLKPRAVGADVWGRCRRRAENLQGECVRFDADDDASLRGSPSARPVNQAADPNSACRSRHRRWSH